MHPENSTLTPTIEEYLETIYNMAMEGDIVIGARLAEKFRVAAPTVTETLKRMVRDGLIDMDNRRQVILTEHGVELAEAVLRRHRLTERFLVEMLGMQWHQVHEEACRLEHHISGAVEARVVTALDHPTTCPHGNPIPGYVSNARTYLRDQGAIRLANISHGSTGRILCVSEVVEDEVELISYLHDRGLTPGTLVTVNGSEHSDEGEESMRISTDSATMTVPSKVAYALWVVPVAS
jgi:DtxR family Mn-dependent transcriptional regulator